MSVVVRAARPAVAAPPEARVYTSYTQIARRVGCVQHRQTVWHYATRKRDPLRIRYRCGKPIVAETVLGPWITRTFGTAEEKAQLAKVQGPEAICRALGRGWVTVLRYAALDVDPLPLEGEGEDAWIYRSALIDWLNAHDVPHSVHISGWDWKGGPTTREDVCPPLPKKGNNSDEL